MYCHSHFLSPDGIPQVCFSSSKEGAVISLPTRAKVVDTVCRADFGDWMIRRIDSWYAWAQRRRVEIDRMEDLILVTGTHRTRSWTNAVFPGDQYAHASFGARVDYHGDGVSIKWAFSHLRNRGVVLNCGPDGDV